MIIKSIKLFSLFLVMNALSAGIAMAGSNLVIGEYGAKSINIEAIELIDNAFAIKKGRPYDEANDTAFRTFNGGPTEGPQHGYFAVPLIVLGIAGILLYFSRND
jgi:hypothetical protein